MNTVILYDKAADEMMGPDHRDVLEQVRAVGEVLGAMGYIPIKLGISLDMAALEKNLKALSPVFVFNLVESISGCGRLIHLAPSVLDFLGIPYTGSSADVLYLTSNKEVSKRLLKSLNLPTPGAIFQEYNPMDSIPRIGESYIIKSVWEHASMGIGDDSVVVVDDKAQLYQIMASRNKTLGGNCFAEEFIEGREFNLSLLTSPKGPEMLPPAEIRFDQYPSGKRKIVDYKAKWEPSSFEYHHTLRSFRFSPKDEPLLKNMENLAVKCWYLFGIRGYARVDFRVDHGNRPWILEVNANPCLSPDAGFAAAAARAGLALPEIIERIVNEIILTPLKEKDHSHAPKIHML